MHYQIRVLKIKSVRQKICIIWLLRKGEPVQIFCPPLFIFRTLIIIQLYLAYCLFTLVFSKINWNIYNANHTSYNKLTFGQLLLLKKGILEVFYPTTDCVSIFIVLKVIKKILFSEYTNLVFWLCNKSVAH